MKYALSSKYIEKIMNLCENGKRNSVLHLNLGRQNGHTWMALQLIKKYRNSFLIVRNANTQNMLYNKEKELKNNKIISASNLIAGRGLIDNRSIIVVDACEAIPKEKIEEIKNSYSKLCKCLIFLG